MSKPLREKTGQDHKTAGSSRRRKLTRRAVIIKACQITAGAAAIGIITPHSADASTGMNAHQTKSESTTIGWKPLTKSDGSKVLAFAPGGEIDEIQTSGTGLRSASWKALSLAYGYYKVDFRFPKNIGNASRIRATYATNPIRVKTVKGSKVITILPEGSSTFDLGAYCANELAIGAILSGPGIPADAVVAVPPQLRTSSTFSMSVAATATSVSTGTPLIITQTFRNFVDQRTGYSLGNDSFINYSLNMLPYKNSTTSTTVNFGQYVWVPALMNSTNPGSMTVTIHDQGCGTPTTSGGRMIADTVEFMQMGKIK